MMAEHRPTVACALHLAWLPTAVELLLCCIPLRSCCSVEFVQGTRGIQSSLVTLGCNCDLILSSDVARADSAEEDLETVEDGSHCRHERTWLLLLDPTVDRSLCSADSELQGRADSGRDSFLSLCSQ